VILNVVHINLNCTDIERSVAFYEKLGFEVVHVFGDAPGEQTLDPSGDVMQGITGPGGARSRGVVLSLGNDPRSTTKIELLEHLSPPTRPTQPRAVHDAGVGRIALRTKNLLDFVTKLKAEGVEFELDPVEIDVVGASRFALFRDPDGVLLELIEFQP
jgi:catechol 2,3-dioxygenase-like lactoylglutathione lyase family enzyme